MGYKKNAQRKGDGVYRRTRVASTLKRALTNPLVIVASPAGYGKTTAVEDFFASVPGRYTVAWTSLTPTDNHPGRFLRNMRRALVDAGADTSSFQGVDDLGLDDVLHAFTVVAESLRYRPPLVLVLDDFHLLSSEVLVRYVEELVKLRLPNVKILIVSRTLPDFPLTDFAIRNMVALVTQDDLRFTESETRGWLRMREIKLSRESLGELMQETDGWISGMYLHTASLMPSGVSIDTLRFLQSSSDDLLHREIFSRYDDEVQKFLLAIAPLDEYPMPLCIAVSGCPDAPGLFERAMRSNMFIRREEGRYQVHHIFGAFLRNRQSSQSPEDYARGLEAAGDWYADSGDVQAAANFYTRAGAHEKLARTIAEILAGFGGIAPVLNIFKREEIRIACAQLDTVPISVMRASVPLLEIFYIGTLMMTRRLEDYQARVTDMYAYYEERLDAPEGRRVLGELLIIDPFLRNESVESRGRSFERARTLLQRPSIFCSRTTPISLGFTSLLFLYYREQAAIDDVVSGYVLHWRRFRDLLDGMMDGMGEILQGELALERGKPEEAVPALEEGRALTHLDDIRIIAGFGLMKCAVLRGDFDACVRHMNEIDEIARAGDRSILYTMADYCRAYLAAVLQDTEIAPRWLLSEDLSGQAPLLSEVNGMYSDLQPRVLLYMNLGFADRIAPHLPRMLSIYEQAESRIGLVYYWISMAVVRFREGDEEAAGHALREAWIRAEASGLVLPFVERSLAVFPLVQHLERWKGAAGDFRAWLSQIAVRMKNWNRAILGIKKKYGRYRGGGGPALSNREGEVLSLLEAGCARVEIRERLGITDNNLKVIMSRLRGKQMLPEAQEKKPTVESGE
ncbi:hypothetical protein LJC31_01195 [Synergistaceae bacterium OttesenSCG-928-I11]|nr:hypothetical protein [Synergistaceae bacterium OttesenSCG-928-I11]